MTTNPLLGVWSVTYRLFNLAIDSAIPLPLLLRSPVDGPADLVFREDAVPLRLAAPCFAGPGYQVGDREFLFEVNGVARYWGQNGRLVVVERSPDASDSHIIPFLLCTVLGALLQQRGIFLLHASAVIRDAGAILIAGESGAGKSTLTAAMVRDGYRLIADDACLITQQANSLLVHPGHPHIRLWHDSLNLLGIPTDRLVKVHPKLDKYYWPVKDSFETAPQPVDALFELATGAGSVTTTAKVLGVSKISTLVNNTYRIEAVEHMASRNDCIAWWAARGGMFNIYRVSRPIGKTGHAGVQSCVAAVTTTIKETS